MMRDLGASMSGLWLLALAGCGPDEASFREDYVASYCAWASECQWYEDADACGAAYVDWAPADTSCFDARAAKDCLDALDALQCPTAGASVEFPDACNVVYSCEVQPD